MQVIEPAPTFALPALYIVTPQASMGDNEPRQTVYPVDSAPIEVFNAWLDGVLEAEGGDALFRFIVARHRETWDDLARLWVVVDFQVRGFDIAKYAYASKEEAEAAMKARQHNV
jgi:hypothetical protein